ncbi:hypothetical protein A3860_31085 [Niastella vici]|uniref:Uncharacterized protein n=1 Tax=Niastella vici TaxID=1703345 RepID=A0A1V9FTQ2_9BACT|nr:hypothetical protein [Niastella vici]OQP61711.1 hypothetical protein A3860_31085 [Niastella vici]
MINPMKIKSALTAVAFIPSLIFAQNYDVKKGKISVEKNLIATYDGKGSIFKLFDLTVSSPSKKPLIHIQEKWVDFKNPLRRDGDRWAEITFLNDPEKKMNYHFPNDGRLIERDLIGLLFKDGTTSLVQGEALNEQAVNDYIKANNFDFVADSQYIRQFEKDNKDRIMEPLSRNKKVATTLNVVGKSNQTSGRGTEYTVRYDIYQDGVLLGQVEKKTIPSLNFGIKAYYVIWKRVLTPYTFEGKTMKFGILAFLEDGSSEFDNELVLMTDKSIIKFKTSDHTNAEYQIVNLLISKGIL